MIDPFHSEERAFTSDWNVNSFIIVVYEIILAVLWTKHSDILIDNHYKTTDQSELTALPAGCINLCNSTSASVLNDLLLPSNRMPMPSTTIIVTWITINVVSMTSALFTGNFALDFNRLTKKKHLLWLN